MSTLPYPCCFGYVPIRMLLSFYHAYKVHAVRVNPCLDRPCYVACYLVICVNPQVRSVDLPPRIIFSRRTPPVFSLLIMSYFQYSHPRKMGSCHHIGKARIFVSCRDCRSAFVLCLLDRFLFFAYPVSGGVNLLLINFQILLIV